ncbi:ABC transporter ATP-binding protein [Ktedonobacter sp. SOSP1-52]|uniref:ABC transporter ATP-binding protein n=1 Tax=Ktedonobacter sp. SOSP1-52 TaxID=2778366 RepID=UPI0019164D6B|nr:ABC transporter ATP-binding protein [Ktedonobacter sp. SOSP1-52]GHO70209.1 ABC transporter ATP-binding protein [Ktedonobacter sp. SOSP1-52]
MSVVYRIEHLTKVYKNASKKANDDISLNVFEGEIFGLLGPNGAGKSTLINQITGLVRPTTGSISLFGMDAVKQPQMIPHYVSLQPQQSIALADLYPEEALLFTAQLRGASFAKARAQVRTLIEELDLGAMRKKRLRFLSGGQRQLVNLAVAMIEDRPIQIFDEPTNNLDPSIRRLVWGKLLALNKRGITIVLVTHNVLEAERVVTRVAIINDGRLLSIGTPGELKARVDQRMKIDLLFKTECSTRGKFLYTLGDVQALTQLHWTLLCDRSNLQHVVAQIVSQIGLECLDDFRILTPSLEDVYLQLGGRKLD